MSSETPSNFPSIAAVGATVRAARRNKRLSQTALGARAGLSRMPVYRIEAGKDISLASLLALLPPLELSLTLQQRTAGPLRASDLAQAFAHLQEEET